MAPPVVLQVAPATGVELACNVGENPQPFNYIVSATRSWLHWRVTGVPNWLWPSATQGRTPATITFSADAAALAAGAYSATLGFLNTDTGVGDTTRAINLVIAAASQPVPSNYVTTWLNIGQV
jgi:hypothetical protein